MARNTGVLTAAGPEPGRASPTIRSSRACSAGARAPGIPLRSVNPSPFHKDDAGRGLGGEDPPAPVQVDDAGPRVVYQLGSNAQPLRVPYGDCPCIFHQHW